MPHKDPEKRKEYMREWRERTGKKTWAYEKERRKDPEYLENRKAYQREYAKRRRGEDQEFVDRIKAGKARYRATDKGMITEAAYREKYYPVAKERAKHHTFKTHHGVTRDEADQMIADRDGLCDVCKRPAEGKKAPTHRLHVDHDKKTGKIRGMLCNRCNTSLGLCREDPSILTSLAVYIAEKS